MPGDVDRVWRVRGWVRALTVLVPVLFLAPIIWPAVFNPTWTTGMPADQYPWVALFYVAFAACIWSSFRSRLDLRGEMLTVTNPWGRQIAKVNEVVDVTPGSYGTEIHLTDDRRLIVFAVQSTFAYWERPRWVDVAEAITGREPQWRFEEDDDWE